MEEKGVVLESARQIQDLLKSESVRVKLDASEQKTPGWKYNHWEMKVSFVPVGFNLKSSLNESLA